MRSYLPLMSNIGFAFVFAAVTTVTDVTPLPAQELLFKAGAGITVPVGEWSERRGAGLSTMVSVELRLSSMWALRLDAERSALRARPAPPGSETDPDYADLRSWGASLNGVLNFPEARVTPYILLGIGGYKLQVVDRARNPYGRTSAIQAGIGLNSNLWKRVNPFLEARGMLHLTDYASSEYSASAYLPILIGVRIR